MGRSPGSRNKDYEATRRQLGSALAQHLVREDGEPATLKDMAAGAGVSMSTLKYYFVDRDGAFEAAMTAVLEGSQPFYDRLAAAEPVPPDRSVSDLLLAFIEAWHRYGVGRIVSSSVALGLEHARRGPQVVTNVLEPFLVAAERLIAAHVERGELPPVPVREAALSTVAPVLLALLHQDGLGGRACRPLDVEAFARRHAQTVLDGLRGPDPARPGDRGDGPR